MTQTPPTRLDIAPFHVDPGRLVTAPSYLIDRFTPACEIIALPSKTVAGGTLTLSRGPAVLHPEPVGGRLKRLVGRKPAQRTISDGVIVDFRLRTPDNWAHILNNHLPIFFRACASLDVSWDETIILLPQDCPSYILRALSLFDLRVVQTDDVVTGDAITFQADPWTGIRAIRAQWVQTPDVLACLEALPATTDLPKRVFIARKSTRALSNMAEVEAWFAARGYVTLYAEDLSAGDQFRLFQEAEEIAAIHGAALAPLLYLGAGHNLRQLVEILPCGHMTDVFRVMAQQVGLRWIGVRGRLKPEYVTPGYTFHQNFKAFSLDSFHVDPASLELAFDLITETDHD